MYDVMSLVFFIDKIFTGYQVAVLGQLTMTFLISVPTLLSAVFVSSGIVANSRKNFNIAKLLWFLLASLIVSSFISGGLAILGDFVVMPALMNAVWLS